VVRWPAFVTLEKGEEGVVDMERILTVALVNGVYYGRVGKDYKNYHQSNLPKARGSFSQTYKQICERTVQELWHENTLDSQQ